MKPMPSKVMKTLFGAVVAVLAVIGIFAITYFLVNDSGMRHRGGITVDRPEAGKGRHSMSTHFSAPQKIWGSAYSLSKVFLRDPDSESRYAGSGSYSSSGYEPEGTMVNILFMNTDTRDFHLLFHAPVIIEAVGYPANRKESRQRKILLDVIAHDSNKDGYINTKDNVILYVADLDGSHLTKVTPDSASVVGKRFIDNFARLVLTLRFNPTDPRLDERYWPTKMYWYDVAKGSLYTYPQLDTLQERSLNILNE